MRVSRDTSCDLAQPTPKLRRHIKAPFCCPGLEPRREDGLRPRGAREDPQLWRRCRLRVAAGRRPLGPLLALRRLLRHLGPLRRLERRLLTEETCRPRESSGRGSPDARRGAGWGEGPPPGLLATTSAASRDASDLSRDASGSIARALERPLSRDRPRLPAGRRERDRPRELGTRASVGGPFGPIG